MPTSAAAIVTSLITTAIMIHDFSFLACKCSLQSMIFPLLA